MRRPVHVQFYTLIAQAMAPVSRLRFFREDAATWLKRHITTPQGVGAYIFFFTLPLSGGIIGRIVKDRPWLIDYDAYACAAETIGRGLSPYSLHPACAGLHPTPYVYAPQIAESLWPVISFMGHGPAKLFYMLAIFAALLYIGWVGMLKTFPKAPPLLRIPVYAVLTGSSLASGNIAIILHALILLGLFQMDKRRWPFVAAVIFAALFKPMMLTCLLVLLYQDRPFLSRLRYGIGAGLLGTGVCAALLLGAGEWSGAWHASINQIVLSEQPGIGFFSWLRWLGIDSTSRLSLVFAGLYMSLLSLMGLFMVEFGRMNADERLIFGLGVAQLVNPRLMDYDILYIAPCLVLMLSLIRVAGKSWYRALSWIFLGTFTAICVLNQLDANALPVIPMSGLAFVLLMGLSFAWMLWMHRKRWIAVGSLRGRFYPVREAAK